MTVAGADVPGLTLEVSEGGSVSGTVTVDGGKPLPREVYVTSVGDGDEKNPYSSVSAAVKPDGTFILTGVPPGGVRIRTNVPPYGNYYTKSATANGVDLLRNPFNLEEGGEVKGVRVVISPEVATLAGRVITGQDGTPLRGAGVMLVPADPTKQRLRGARRNGFANAEGFFTVTAPPGEYTAVVLRPGDDALDDDTIKARAAGGQAVTLQPSERKNVTLVAPTGK